MTAHPGDTPLKSTPGALTGVRVVEVGEGISSSFGARILADFGADVVKIEQPEGDPLRHAGVRMKSCDGLTERSALFEYLNWGKRSVTRGPVSEKSLPGLIESADIVIVGSKAKFMTDLGLETDALAEKFPHLAVVVVSDFGSSGVRSGWVGSELVCQAVSGLMAVSGQNGREPLMRGLRQSAYATGFNVAYTALAAHLGSRRGLSGAVVDLSRAEVLSSELVLNQPTYAFMGAIQGRRRSGNDPLATGEPIKAADGYVTTQVTPLVDVSVIASLLGEPALDDARFATAEGRLSHASELRALLTGALSDWNGRDYFEAGGRIGALTGFLQSAANLLECPQLEARGVFREITGTKSPLGGPWRFPGTIATLERTPARFDTAAPAIGNANDDIAWHTRQARPRDHDHDHDGARARSGPLSGLNVLDLSTVFAVPYIGGLLADLGANVVKIEATDRIDQTRGTGFGPWFENRPGPRYWDRSGIFQVLNRGKRAVALNLKTQEGRRVLTELVKDADILLDNFTPRVLRGWGLPHEVLSEINRELIHLSNTGYGSTGPWSGFKAQGTTLEATMGVANHGGYPGEAPSKIGQSYPDFLAAWAGLTAVMAALVHRERTGEGQWIDLGMYQLGASVIPEALIEAQAGLPDRGTLGNREMGAVFSGVFRERGDDRWIAISIADKSMWERFRAVVPGLTPDLPRERDMGSVEETVARWSIERPGKETVAELQRHRVAAAPVSDVRDLVRDEHLRARGFYEFVDHGAEVGWRPIIGRPYRWSGAATSVHVTGRAPRFGEHNDEILADCGLNEHETAALYRDEVTSREPLAAPTVAPADLSVFVSTGVYREIDSGYLDVLADAHTTNNSLEEIA